MGLPLPLLPSHSRYVRSPSRSRVLRLHRPLRATLTLRTLLLPQATVTARARMRPSLFRCTLTSSAGCLCILGSACRTLTIGLWARSHLSRLCRPDPLRPHRHHLRPTLAEQWANSTHVFCRCSQCLAPLRSTRCSRHRRRREHQTFRTGSHRLSRRTCMGCRVLRHPARVLL